MTPDERPLAAIDQMIAEESPALGSLAGVLFLWSQLRDVRAENERWHAAQAAHADVYERLTAELADAQAENERLRTLAERDRDDRRQGGRANQGDRSTVRVAPMTGHDLDHDDGMFEVPGSRLREMTDTVADLRAKLAAAEQEREAADKEWRNVNFQSIELIRQQRGRADRAEAALAAVGELPQTIEAELGQSWARSADPRAGHLVSDLLERPMTVDEEQIYLDAVDRGLKRAVVIVRAALAAAEQPEPTPEQP